MSNHYYRHHFISEEIIVNCYKLDKLHEKYRKSSASKAKWKWDENQPSMISKRTLQTLRLSITLGYYLGLLPWKWDDENNCLCSIEISSSCKPRWFPRWEIMSVLNLVWNMWVFLWLNAPIFLTDMKTSEIMFCLALDSVLLCAVLFQLVSIFLFDEQELVLNSSLHFNRKYARTLKYTKKDGLEGVCNSYILSGGSMVLCTVPAAIWTFHNRLNVTFCFNWLADSGVIPIPILYLALGFGGMYTAFLNAVAIMGSQIGLMMFLNFMKIWFEENVCSTTNSSNFVAKEEEILLFRAHQILQIRALNLTYSILPGIMFVAIICMVTSTFCVIHSHNQLNEFTLLLLSIISFISCLTYDFGIKAGNGVVEKSLDYAHSFTKDPSWGKYE